MTISDAQRTCPFDPALQADIRLDLFPCPVCGCAVIAGLPHGPCTDPACFYYAESTARLHHPSALLPGISAPRDTRLLR